MNDKKKKTTAVRIGEAMMALQVKVSEKVLAFLKCDAERMKEIAAIYYDDYICQLGPEHKYEDDVALMEALMKDDRFSPREKLWYAYRMGDFLNTIGQMQAVTMMMKMVGLKGEKA